MKSKKSDKAYYSSNMEYLKDLEGLMEILVKKYSVKCKLQGNVPLNAERIYGLEPEKKPEKKQSKEELQKEFEIVSREFSAKLSEIERKSKLSLENNIDIFVEKLVKIYKLDKFDKLLLIFMFFMETNPGYKSKMLGRNRPQKEGFMPERSCCATIGKAIEILCDSYEESLSARKYFTSKARMVRNSVLVVENPAYYERSNVLELSISLTQEAVNFILGDRNDYFGANGDVDTEIPEVKFEDVIIEENTKERIRGFLDNYSRYFESIKNLHIGDVSRYGNSTVFLFYGPSGTGKTMLAKSIANYMKRPLMSVNFKEIARDRFRQDDTIKRVMRKAQMTESILFIDECDDIFENNRMDSRSFLIEIEKINGIVILATNQILKLDHAMDRRITFKVRLGVPGLEMRKKIWGVHIPDKSILSKDVDFDLLARKYIFTGGLIKNAVLHAVSQALLSGNKEKMKIIQDNLLNAAEYTKNQMLYPLYYSNPEYPDVSLASLKLNEVELKNVKGVLNVLKNTDARGKPVRVLFYGSHANKLISISEAIAGEMNIPFNVLPADLLYNKESEYYNLMAANFNNVSYYKFLQMITDEFAEVESIPVFVDEKQELFKVETENNKRINDLARRLTDIKRHVIVIHTGEKFNPDFARKYFDYVVSLSGSSIEERQSAWERIKGRDIELENNLNLETLAGTFELTKEEIGKVATQLVLDRYFYGRKLVTFKDVAEAVKKFAFKTKEFQLFGK